MQRLAKFAFFLTGMLVDSFTLNSILKHAQSEIGRTPMHNQLNMIDPSHFNFKITSPSQASSIDYQIFPSQLLVSSNPNVEAEVFADIAHLVLDFATVFASDTIKLRALIFAGRICSILADYVPDHSMTFDEVVFQTAMLAIAGNKLFKTVIPALYALSRIQEKSSFHDLKIYRTTFHPAGFSYLDYHIISSALEWVDLHAGSTYVEKDFPCLFLIYHGQVNTTNGEIISRQKGKRAVKMIGDLSTARLFQKNKVKQEIQSNEHINTRLKIQAGPHGAKILRINIKELLRIVQENDTLIDSTKNLIFNAIEEKFQEENPTQLLITEKDVQMSP
jgi:hypothetical protein